MNPRMKERIMWIHCSRAAAARVLVRLCTTSHETSVEAQLIRLLGNASCILFCNANLLKRKMTPTSGIAYLEARTIL
jgi:hypothetical protein